jgi:hypothetical protein
MQVSRCVIVAMLGTVLLVSACKQDKVEEKHHPAKIEESGQEGIMKVTLEPRAAERIGLQTAAIVAYPGAGGVRLAVPYGAVMYDTKGEAWTFTNPEPLVFVRHKIVVESVEGDQAILAEGPPPGTAVVTVGAAELMGAEHKYGH